MTRALKSPAKKSACRRTATYAHADGAQRSRAALGRELPRRSHALPYTVRCEKQQQCLQPFPIPISVRVSTGVFLLPKTSPSFRVRACYSTCVSLEGFSAA